MSNLKINENVNVCDKNKVFVGKQIRFCNFSYVYFLQKNRLYVFLPWLKTFEFLDGFF